MHNLNIKAGDACSNHCVLKWLTNTGKNVWSVSPFSWVRLARIVINTGRRRQVGNSAGTHSEGPGLKSTPSRRLFRLSFFVVFLRPSLTNSMEQSPSWEANRSSASQEIPRIIMEPEGSLPHSQEPATCP
jgi:hypothetical protein